MKTDLEKLVNCFIDIGIGFDYIYDGAWRNRLRLKHIGGVDLEVDIVFNKETDRLSYIECVDLTTS